MWIVRLNCIYDSSFHFIVAIHPYESHYHVILPNIIYKNSITRSKNKEFLSPEQMIVFLNGPQRDPRLNEILYPRANKPFIKILLDKFEKEEKFRQIGVSSTKASFFAIGKTLFHPVLCLRWNPRACLSQIEPSIVYFSLFANIL